MHEILLFLTKLDQIKIFTQFFNALGLQYLILRSVSLYILDLARRENILFKGRNFTFPWELCTMGSSFVVLHL